MKFESMAVVLYEKPLYFKKSDPIIIPDKAFLRVYIEKISRLFLMMKKASKQILINSLFQSQLSQILEELLLFILFFQAKNSTAI